MVLRNTSLTRDDSFMYERAAAIEYCIVLSGESIMIAKSVPAEGPACPDLVQRLIRILVAH
jgi:hypothetical protein